jgi:hypothetical protein
MRRFVLSCPGKRAGSFLWLTRDSAFSNGIILINPLFGKIRLHVRLLNLIKKGMIALLLVIVFFCIQSVPSEKSLSAQIPESELTLLLKKKINEWRASSKNIIAGEQIYSSVLVERFYKVRNYQPAWSQNGRLLQAEILIKALEEAYGDGLTPAYYHLRSYTISCREGGEGIIL